MKKVFVTLSLTCFIVICIFTAVTKNNKTAAKKTPTIYGIVLPHHGLAKDLLNNSFQRLKASTNPKVIVVYGTNHYFPISDTYTTTTQVVEEYDLKNILADNTRVSGDHSIGTLIPYIKNYFPDAKIIPILVSGRYNDVAELKKEAITFTHKFGGTDTLYIASVDFAHNLSLNEGLANNTESINEITNFNYSTLLSYNDSHMDSPTTVSTLLQSMQSLGATSWTTWYSSHGALITNSQNAEGTSYVVGIFTKPN